MFNPNKKSFNAGGRKLRYPPNREGLSQAVAEIKRLLGVVSRLPLGEQTFSAGIHTRRGIFKNYLGYIVNNDPRANVQASVGYGAALEISMLQELEALLNYSDDVFAEKAKLISELNPEGFSEIEIEFNAVLAKLVKVIDSEDECVGIVDVVDHYNKVDSIITPLFTFEVEEIFEKRKRKLAEANKELADLMSVL